MAVTQSRKKKSSTKKAVKAARKTERTKRTADEQNDTVPAATRKQNPKAFVFSSRGKAKKQQARSAEKDQRRLHGMLQIYSTI